MTKMKEEDFDSMEFNINAEHTHKFVKLYTLGTHTDYGCIICGLKTLTPELFKEDKINDN